MRFKGFLCFVVIALVINSFNLTSKAIDPNSIEFDFMEKKPSEKKSIKEIEPKIMIKVNYDENPNKMDFFTRNDLGQCIDLAPFEDLYGYWQGTYELNESTIKWINPKIPESEIYKKIHFGTYDISLKLNGNEKIYSIEILQDNIEYAQVYFNQYGDKQLNYWTKAISDNWFEVIRGKIGKRNKDELYTIFQTTVYDNNIPLYAFRGQASLYKK